MWLYVAPLLFAVFAWWFSTGAILCLGRRSPAGRRQSMVAMTLVAAGALIALEASAARTDAAGAYLAFGAALAVWGWHEMSFLFGYVTGPRRSPCPAGARGWARFRYAFETILHHELAILATALLIGALTWGEPNQVGTLTFLILWLMRISAKLNIFFGTPHLTDVFLPRRLAYLKSYFRKDPVGAFFAASMILSILCLALLIGVASGAAGDAFAATGATLLATLLALAILEHLFFVLPLPDAALWGWAMPSPGPGRAGRAGNDHDEGASYITSAEADSEALRAGSSADPTAAPDRRSGSRTEQRFFRLKARPSPGGVPQAPSTPGMSP